MSHGSPRSFHVCNCCLLATGWISPRQVFEGLDREGKGFLTAEGIKEVVGLDFDTEEVCRPEQMRVAAGVSGSLHVCRLVSYSE